MTAGPSLPGLAAALARCEAQARLSPRNHWLRLQAVLLCLQLGRPAEAWQRLEAVSQSAMLGPGVIDACRHRIARALVQGGEGAVARIDRPQDYHLSLPPRGFLPALPALRADRRQPSGFPFEMALPALTGSGNDFGFLADAAGQTAFGPARPALRLHVVAQIDGPADLAALRDSLAAQTWPAGQLRLSVFSTASLPQGDMGLPTSWHSGRFWQMPRSRQMALLAAQADVLVMLDRQTRLEPTALERAARYLHVSQALVLPLLAVPERTEELAGPRPGPGVPVTVLADRIVQKGWAGLAQPFTRLAGADLALPVARFRALDGFDPRFATAQAAARELAFRAATAGSYLLPLAVALAPALPPAPEADTGPDADLLRQLCPPLRGRDATGPFEVPKVSLYIPAYKAARFITDAVDSVLSQDYEDLEVCIGNDGSPDRTLEVLERQFGSDPRVSWVSNRNGGIGAASNAAIRASRGMYVGQLDSDDLLKPGAVRRLAEYLDANPAVGCVYSSCERVDADGVYLQDEYSFPVFSREKMMLTSIAHHFRMFRRQVWERTTGFREDIVNAVDYDMFLKMSEVAPFHHIDEKLYQRRWHGANTSNVNESFQTTNTHVVQRKALERLGLERHWDVHVPDPALPRTITYRRIAPAARVFFWPDYSRHNPYQRLLYAGAREGVEFIGADLGAALRAARDAKRPGKGNAGSLTFHLHWLNKILEPAETEAAADAAVAEFLGKLRELKALGGRLVWTVHNVLSHDLPWQAAEITLARGILDLADAVHVHSAASVPEIEAVYPLPQDKLRVARHGAYGRYYPDFISQTTARGMLGLDPGDDVLLFIGQIRPYKGVEQLVAAFRALLRDRPRAVLLLAGQMRQDLFAALPEALTPEERARVRLYNRFIDDGELQLFFRAADVAVFPYRNILTSGSLLLALSFGVPAVVPRVGMTQEVLEGSQAGLLYDAAAGPDRLEAALRQILAVKEAGGLQAMSTAARALAQTQVWQDMRPLFCPPWGEDPA